MQIHNKYVWLTTHSAADWVWEYLMMKYGRTDPQIWSDNGPLAIKPALCTP